MPILKLDKHNERKERKFELEYLLSLTTQQRFKMMLAKSQEILKMLYGHEKDRNKTHIIART